MKAKLIKENLNEGTYEDFFMNYGEELKNAITILKEISKKIRNKELSEDDVIPVLDKLERIYDKKVVNYIGDSALGQYSVDARDIAQIAIDNMNREGTEVQMILYAIEELGADLDIYPGMDESKKNMKAKSLNEGFATEEGRKLNSIANLLGYDDLEEMLGDNPGLFEACIEWIDRFFGEQLAKENMDPAELERLGLYDVAHEARKHQEGNEYF